MQVSAVDEPPEVLTLEEDIKDDVLQEPFETNTAATAENDVIILEESAVVSPPLVLTTVAPETGSKYQPCRHKHVLSCVTFNFSF